MKKDIEAYLSAIELEADSEAIYYKEFGVTGAATQIPRVLRLLGTIKKNQTAVNFFLPILSWCYSHMLAPIFFFYRAIYVALRLKAKHSKCAEIQHRKNIYLATSNGANLAFVSPTSSFPDFIITTPFRGDFSENILPDLQRVSVLSLVNLLDIAGAWCNAVLANWCLLRVNDGRNVLWGYTALEWFLIYKVLMRLKPKAIWISNHHDRWFMLSTSIPDVSVNMVQHGRLFHILPNGKQISYKRFSKITGVTAIYAIDNQSERFFSDFIDTQKISFYRINVSLSLVPWRFDERSHLKILVIGGSNNIEFYLDLMNSIRDAIVQPVALAIRHHPLQKRRLSDITHSFDYWELSSNESLPEPDMVVTYGSSLDDQLLDLTRAKFITYTWSDQIDMQEIVQRVKSVATNLVRA